jgi:cyclophilin family peptidyl-prolyl cis-trans isomerase
VDCPEAPSSCLSFLQLAGQGFYDGLPFYRVVPGLLVQTGDPRGDGLGGPGYVLRDEIHPARFGRGTVGLVRPEPDSAGSQIFITLSRQPDLDGRYTVLGRVVRGLDVLDRLVEGDLLTKAEVLR